MNTIGHGTMVEFSLLDYYINMIVELRKEVKPTAFQNCFRHADFIQTDDQPNENDLPLVEQARRLRKIKKTSHNQEDEDRETPLNV